MKGGWCCGCVQVYEHLVFEGHEHVSLLRLPGMQDRCVRIGSAGKTFSLTGWKVRCAATDSFWN